MVAIEYLLVAAAVMLGAGLAIDEIHGQRQQLVAEWSKPIFAPNANATQKFTPVPAESTGAERNMAFMTP